MTVEETMIESKIIPKFIKNLVPGANLKSFDIKLLSGDTFMLTICYQVHLVVVNANSELQNYYLFVKITPECEPDMYDLVQFRNLFTNEINAYTHIIPTFDRNQKYVRLRDSEVQRYSSYLVLDDFTKFGGWRLAKEMVNLSLDHIIAAMHELAVFHGKSYGLKIRSPDKFIEIVELLHESRYNSELPDNYNVTVKAKCVGAINCVRNSDLKDEIPESFLQKLENLLADPHNYGRQIVRPTEPLSTLCHGDYLRNNLAFRYELDEDGNEIPIDAMMFDLQTIRHSSPMVDVCVFICNSTGIDVRGPNFDKIFDSYYNTLIDTIKQDLKDDELPEYFNRRRFLQEYVKYLPLGLSIASYFLPVLNNKDELVLDLADPLGPEKIAEKIMSLGGENIDREYRSIIHQMYRLSEELDVDIFTI